MVAYVDIGEMAVKLREKQISILLKELFIYKVLLKDLVGHSPNYRDKTIILNIAYYIIEDTEIFEKISKKRELPFGKLGKETGASRAFLEIWQDYILAYVIILSNPNYKYIQDYLRVELKDESTAIELYQNKKVGTSKGLVLKVNGKSAIIMTTSGDFTKIKNTEQLEVGSEGEGRIKKGLTDYKVHIAIATVIIMLVSFGLYKDYNKVRTTVVITCTSQIKFELNRGNTIIYVHTAADKGKNMVATVNPMDENIDIALKACVDYAKNNNMIPDVGLVVTITGVPLKYGVLKETAQYVVDNNIVIKVNNAGNFHNIYELAEKTKEDENEGK
jgi:hypothetical protein